MVPRVLGVLTVPRVLGVFGVLTVPKVLGAFGPLNITLDAKSEALHLLQGGGLVLGGHVQPQHVDADCLQIISYRHAKFGCAHRLFGKPHVNTGCRKAFPTFSAVN